LERGVRNDTWSRVCTLIGRPELVDDARFVTPAARREHQAELGAILEAWTSTRPKEEIYHTLQQLHSVAGYVATVADLVTSEQLVTRQFFQTLDHPCAGTAQYPGAAFTIQGMPWQHDRAPLLGEHNVTVYCERLGYTQEELAQLRSRGIV
jgi:crotonobetainyl-CoA:carnitine CoA-transferase CaiB-like acyl-CoA transferase